MLSFGGSGTNLLAIMTNDASNATARIQLILLKGLNISPLIFNTSSGTIPGPLLSSSTNNVLTS